jgi:hypothetical protein
MGNIVLPWRYDYDVGNNRGDVHAQRPPSYVASMSAATPSQIGGALRPDGVRLHSNKQCNFSGSLWSADNRPRRETPERSSRAVSL